MHEDRYTYRETIIQTHNCIHTDIHIYIHFKCNYKANVVKKVALTANVYQLKQKV